MHKSHLLGAVCVCLSAMCSNVNAAILSYGGYTHDTSTDIVTGNGLEWLQWDVTVGESINSIQSQLGTLEGGGWSIASNTQMAQLFNAFDFGYTFDTDENTSQTVSTGYQLPDSLSETDQLFIAMFGDTYAASGSSFCYLAHCFQSSSAYFGTDLDGDSLYNYASVTDDYQSSDGVGMYNGEARIDNDGVPSAYTFYSVGVALVRPAVVPVPAAAWLFGTGLLGLIGIARRKKS